jgi:hypothetical protein
MTRKSTRFMSITAAVAVGLATAAGALHASSAPGFMGRARFSADAHCFEESWGAAVNTCSTMKQLLFPLVSDGTPNGWHDVIVSAFAALPSNNVSCTAISVDANGVPWDTDGPRQLSTFGTAKDLLFQVHAPGHGALYVFCDVQPGGRVNLVNW